MATVQSSLRRVLGLRNAPQSHFSAIYWFELQRAFSTTSAVRKVHDTVPKFKPTSNPELDAHLDNIREEHFIPCYLPKGFHRLVYSSKNHARLLEDPITITLDGEPYTLKPKKDPRGSPSWKFMQALELMKEPSDFDVLPELIRGYTQTNSKMGRQPLQRLVRKLVKIGNVDILMLVARTAEKTGFLFNLDNARSFMHALRERQQGPAREDVVKALRCASELVLIIGRRELTTEPDSPTRYSNDPIILGIELSMYADTALRSNEEWHKKATEEIALRLKDVWENIEWKPARYEYDGKSSKTLAKTKYYDLQNLIRGYSATLEGMLQAKSVLSGSELSPWLETESEKLATLITQLSDCLQKSRPFLFANSDPRKGSEEEKSKNKEDAEESAEGSVNEDVEIK